MMTNFSGNKKIIYIFLSMIILILVSYFYLIDETNPSLSAVLENDVEVNKNSELIYYLDVSYDGVDKNGVNSESGVMSNINSEVIYVEDKIPEGLLFTGFVTTSNGSIGAYRESSDVSCLGKVIDDTPDSNGKWNSDNTEFTYHGLHYNANTRIVSFKVNNLQAGCVLTVGIKTMTPSETDDPNTEVVESRRDFYNFGSASEGNLNVNSNITHVYMGSENVNLYKVNYQYVGDVPENAPILPGDMSYASGTKVGVANNVNLNGYSFSGWSSNDVNLNEGVFDMPNSDVTFTGSFTALPKYKVNYLIDGEYPSDYVLPLEKEYYENDIVKVDSLAKDTILNGYMFSGWKVNGEDITEFKMPNSDVEIVGSFEEIKYKIDFKFYDSILPPDSDTLLPESIYSKPGDIITLPNVINEPEGYKFLGWYYEDKFKMPEENITIYGEWKKVFGTFEPTIEQTLISEDKSYDPGEDIIFKIVVTNTADFDINNVMIRKNLKESIISSDDNLLIESDEYIKFNKIPAGENVEFILTYKVKDSDYVSIQSVVELTGALADNNYELVDKDYKTAITAKLSKELIETPITNKNSISFVVIAIIIIVIGIGLIVYAKRRKK